MGGRGRAEVWYIFGYESDVCVWLINHTQRQAASYVGTWISEGDQSLGKSEISAVPQES